ncbi:MAG: AAA family ATPase [Chloroflexota bacterium]|nr:AAA family ATPase [Chloroflexota bacterium]
MPDERKTVTVLFADVVGSTAMGSQRDPELVRDVLRRFFARMKAIAESHGGTVEKYIGDAVMVIFGLPRLHEDDAERAVRAALAMRAATAELEAELRIGLAIRLGVNTGEAVAGAGDTPQFLVTGDAINVGARLEQAAEAGEILVGERTRTLSSTAVEYGPARRVIAKGKAEPVLAHPAIRARTEVPIQHRGLAPLRADLVGREKELRVLLEAISAVTAGARPQLLTVLGQAGVGKSRLVEEALGRAGETSLRVLRGRCLPYGTDSAYWAFGEVIRSDARIVLDDDKPSALAKLDARVRELFADVPQRALVRARLAVLIGLEDRDAALSDVVKERIAAELVRGLRRYLEAIAASEGPLVLVIEDLQWGERPVLDALEDLIDRPDTARILLVCLARPELVELYPGWAGSRANAMTVMLEPLSDRDIATLIARLLKLDDLPPALRELIGRGSGGNPLFCEELLRMLIDDGTIVHQGETWRSTAPTADIRIPDSVQAVLGARLDSLLPPEKLALQTASVLGERFSSSVLFGLRTPAELAPAPESLVRKGMFVESDDGETLTFRHVLIRDVAYSSLAKAERADLHERAVARLVETARDRVAEISEVLAYHAERAFALTSELPERREQRSSRASSAIDRLAAAADRAAGLYSNEKAAELYSRAIAIAWAEQPNSKLLVSLYDRRGRALELLNDFVQAQANYEDMEHRASDLGDESMLLDALSRQATIHAVGAQQLDRNRGEALIDRALEIALRRGDKPIVARLKWSYAHLAVWTGRLQLAIQSAGEAVTIARDQGLKEELAYALNILARGEAQSGGLDAAMEHWAEAAELFDGLRNGPMLADTRAMIASVKVANGDYDGALAAASDVYRLSEESHNPWGQGMSRMTTANVQWERGDYGGAIRALEEALRFGNAAKANWVEGAQLWLVLLHLAAGDQEGAFAQLGGTAALASVVDADSAPPLLVLVLAHAAVLRGDLDEARRLRTKAEAPAVPSQVHAVIALVSAEIALANTEYASAAQIAHDAIEAYDRGGLLNLNLDTDLKWIEGDALLRAGALTAASAALARARLQAERKSRRTLWLILWSLARLADAEGRGSDGVDLRRRARTIVDEIANSLASLGLADSFRRTPQVSALLAET